MMRPVLAILLLLAAPAAAQPQSPARNVGDTVRLRVEDLPPPEPRPAVANDPVRVERPTGKPVRVPQGFAATLFRDGVEDARNLLVLPDGGVLVAQQGPGTLTLLRDADDDGAAEETWLWAAGFDRPFGLVFHAGFVFVGAADGVWRLPWREGATAAAGERRPVTPPGALGTAARQPARGLALSADGRRLFVGVGSREDLAEEEEPYATIQEFALDESGSVGPARTLAGGLRNASALAVRPGTDDLYATVDERDGMGDALVPDFLARVEPGGFYGWPYAYLGRNAQPGFAGRNPDRVAQSLAPDLLFAAHSAPLGLVFADRTDFPQRYRKGAFVALHGSSSRAEPAGYAVVFVPFDGDRPAGGYELFATGFRLPDPPSSIPAGPPAVWGRPAGLAVAKDGSLLIADSFGAVWRVAYGSGGPPRKPARQKR